ncbi:hypothetical protein CDQ92_19560 [Sphingopyxis bauzanensis]|uniref:Uncharacterized protein n=1 Tax=Sphingopyxis bauzanensis TaxID=651663 RepID=A0A246JJD1_9SPHN|nr:hypothetical protein CDQ92_19560 [Sphingopyxis bauzanensis]GGJ60890.1 hypothetical protein GCM10011393_33960 [Sphingopyxis bauzanensis]
MAEFRALMAASRKSAGKSQVTARFAMRQKYNSAYIVLQSSSVAVIWRAIRASGIHAALREMERK